MGRLDGVLGQVRFATSRPDYSEAGQELSTTSTHRFVSTRPQTPLVSIVVSLEKMSTLFPPRSSAGSRVTLTLPFRVLATLTSDNSYRTSQIVPMWQSGAYLKVHAFDREMRIRRKTTSANRRTRNRRDGATPRGLETSGPFPRRRWLHARATDTSGNVAATNISVTLTPASGPLNPLLTAGAGVAVIGAVAVILLLWRKKRP